MTILTPIAAPPSMLYWLNLAVAVTLIGSATLAFVKVIQNRSEVLRHALFVASLIILLAAPIAIWVGSHSQLGLLTIENSALVDTPAISSHRRAFGGWFARRTDRTGSHFR